MEKRLIVLLRNRESGKYFVAHVDDGDIYDLCSVVNLGINKDGLVYHLDDASLVEVKEDDYTAEDITIVMRHTLEYSPTPELFDVPETINKLMCIMGMEEDERKKILLNIFNEYKSCDNTLSTDLYDLFDVLNSFN